MVLLHGKANLCVEKHLHNDVISVSENGRCYECINLAPEFTGALYFQYSENTF
jgi:hypothetical protein